MASPAPGADSRAVDPLQAQRARHTATARSPFMKVNIIMVYGRTMDAVTTALGTLAGSYQETLDTLARFHFTEGLWARRVDMWTDDTAVQQKIAHRLGWLDALAVAEQHVDRARACAAAGRFGARQGRGAIGRFERSDAAVWRPRCSARGPLRALRCSPLARACARARADLSTCVCLRPWASGYRTRCTPARRSSTAARDLNHPAPFRTRVCRGSDLRHA